MFVCEAVWCGSEGWERFVTYFVSCVERAVVFYIYRYVVCCYIVSSALEYGFWGRGSECSSLGVRRRGVLENCCQIKS